MDQDERISGMEGMIYLAASTGNNINGLLLREAGLSQILTPTKNTVLHIYIACASRTNTGRNIIIRDIEDILTACPALLFQPNEEGETPLHIAARLGHDDIVTQLIRSAGERFINETPLSIAAKLGYDDIVTQLIRSSDERLIIRRAGERLIIRTASKNDKNTALHEAVRFNHLDVVRALITADPEAFNCVNNAGETPLYMAAERGLIDIVAYIISLDGPDPAYDGPDGRTALHAAVIYNDNQMMNTLLNRNINYEKALTEAVDKLGWTALHYAAFHGHCSIVNRLLLSNECAAYIRDKDDRKTALHVAASRGHLDVVKELLSRCPDCCEVVDKRHQNLLHYAIQNKKYHIIEFVRKDPWLSHVLLNGKDEDQNTPFHQLASLSKDKSCTRGPADYHAILKVGRQFICDSRVDKMSFNNKNKNAFDIIQANDTVHSRRNKMFLNRLIKNGCRRGERIKEGNEVEKESQVHDKLAWQEITQVNLVIVTLIAAVTFTAGMAVPGGFNSEKGPDQGLAVLRRQPSFQGFFMCNTIAMLLSGLSVLMHLMLVILRRVPGHQNVWLLSVTPMALVCMLFGFIFCSLAVLGSMGLWWLVWGVSLGAIALMTLTLLYVYDNISEYYSMLLRG